MSSSVTSCTTWSSPSSPRDGKERQFALYTLQGQTGGRRPLSVDRSLRAGTARQRSLMSTTRTRRLVISLVGAMLMLLPASLATAQDQGDPNRPVDVAFTKWVTTSPLMEGYWGDDLANKLVGEVFPRQVSQRQADTCFLPAPNCGRILRLAGPH